MGDTLVILPTYNESENIARIVSGVLDQDSRIEVLVVDDNSPDGTSKIVRKKFREDGKVHLMVREEDRGRGSAGIAGFKWAIERTFRYVIEMDADGSHNPAYLPDLIKTLQESDVAICSRLVPGGGETGRNVFRKWVTLIANAYLRIVLGLKVADCTTGYRGFRREVLEAAPWDLVKSNGPAIVQEILFIAVNQGASVKEIPFTFEERHAGESKLNMKILLMGLIEAFKIRFRMSGRLTEKINRE